MNRRQKKKRGLYRDPVLDAIRQDCRRELEQEWEALQDLVKERTYPEELFELSSEDCGRGYPG